MLTIELQLSPAAKAFSLLVAGAPVKMRSQLSGLASCAALLVCAESSMLHVLSRTLARQNRVLRKDGRTFSEGMMN